MENDTKIDPQIDENGVRKCFGKSLGKKSTLKGLLGQGGDLDFDTFTTN